MGGRKSFLSFIFALFWFYPEDKYSVMMYVGRNAQRKEREETSVAASEIAAGEKCKAFSGLLSLCERDSRAE